MPRRPHLLLSAPLLLLAACGDPAAPPPAGRFDVQTPASEPDDAALAEQLRSTKGPLLVFAHDDATIVKAAAARAASGREDVRIVGTPGNGSVARLDDGKADAVVTVSMQALAAAATDLCLLAVSGIAPPPQIEIGARWFTRANRAAGGQTLPSPAEFALAALRQQHAEVLTKTPKTDVVFRIGLVLGGRDERSSRLVTALTANAREYPQLQVRLGNDPREFLDDNVNALMVAGAGSPALVEACEEATSRGIKVIGIATDLPTRAMSARAGIDEASLGQAAAEAIGALLPGGGHVLELGYRADDPARVLCRNGFAAALAARQPR